MTTEAIHRPRRPATVVLVAGLLVLAAAIQVAIALVAIAIRGPVQEVYYRVGAVTPTMRPEAVESGYLTMIVVSAVSAGILALLAGFVWSGQNWARWAVWTFGGLVLLCNGCGFMTYTRAPLSGIAKTRSPFSDTETELGQQVKDVVPNWAFPVTITAAVVTMVLMALVIVLLAMPVTQAYFRRPRPAA